MQIIIVGRLISTQEDVDDILTISQLNEIQTMDRLEDNNDKYESVKLEEVSISISEDKMIVNDKRTADVWCAESTYINTENFCTRNILSVINTDDSDTNDGNKNDNSNVSTNRNNLSDTKGNSEDGKQESFDEIIQPAYHIIDTTIRLCQRCQKLFDRSLIVHDTSELLSFTCQSNLAIDMGLAYPFAEQSLKNEKYKYYNPINMYIKRMLYNQAVELISEKDREVEKEHSFEGRIVQVNTCIHNCTCVNIHLISKMISVRNCYLYLYIHTYTYV